MVHHLLSLINVLTTFASLSTTKGISTVKHHKVFTQLKCLIKKRKVKKKYSETSQKKIDEQFFVFKF